MQRHSSWEENSLGEKYLKTHKPSLSTIESQLQYILHCKEEIAQWQLSAHGFHDFFQVHL